MKPETRYEKGYGDGFERGYLAGLDRAGGDGKAKVPANHLSAGTDIEKMSRPELIDLLGIKCATIDQQGAREKQVIKKVSDALNRQFHQSVPMETAVDALIHQLVNRK